MIDAERFSSSFTVKENTTLRFTAFAVQIARLQLLSIVTMVNGAILSKQRFWLVFGSFPVI